MTPMLKTMAALAFAAAWAAAQTAPAARPPAARAATAAPSPAGTPSVKDLKFPPLKPIPIPNVTTATLPNGMKLYLLEDHELPMIHGSARVRTGNLFDPPDKVGLATLTGQVMRTGGSQAKTGDEWNRELEDMAATVESGIGETSGSVSFSTLKENIDPVLAIFKDVLTAPEFRQDKLDLAKVEMRSGIARRNDDPGGVSEREFVNTVYGKDTPYGWSLEYATVARIQRADLVAFHDRYFFPKNTLLAVWGDFDTAAMKDKIERLFANWTTEREPVPPFPQVRPESSAGIYLAARNDVTQTFFAIGQLGGELRDKDYPALEVMADILGGGFQSRLFQRVRTRMGDAYNIGASWAANYDHPGLFEISGSTKSSSTVETIRAIQEEVARIRTAEVSDDELQSAKETALNSLVFAFDTKTKTLGRLLNYEYYGYPKDFIQQYQKALAAVTRADVLRVAKEHLDPAKFTTVAVGDPQAFAQPLSVLGPVNDIDLTIPEPQAAPSDPASLEKGKQLLARAQQAAGGADKLAAITDFSRTMAVQVEAAAGGLKAGEVDRWIAPRVFRQDLDLPGRTISSFLNGRSGWIATPEGSGPLAGAQLKQVQGDLFRLYFRLLLSDREEGRIINAVDDRTVEISSPSGELAEMVFDAQTGMPQGIRYLAVQAAGPPIVAQDTWSDFREVAGVKIPYRTTLTRNGVKYAEVTLSDCKANTGLKLEDLQRRP